MHTLYSITPYPYCTYNNAQVTVFGTLHAKILSSSLEKPLSLTLLVDSYASVLQSPSSSWVTGSELSLFSLFSPPKTKLSYIQIIPARSKSQHKQCRFVYSHIVNDIETRIQTFWFWIIVSEFFFSKGNRFDMVQKLSQPKCFKVSGSLMLLKSLLWLTCLLLTMFPRYLLTSYRYIVTCYRYSLVTVRFWKVTSNDLVLPPVNRSNSLQS
jgi:hypothetical protein